ncbi:MAG: Holliday junction branch migration protein RuvA [Verrucomicrobiales bacterium]|nr:Holliday junction branch migration protein RuvA [Verrucomicrobiales bacterium]MED5585490.1 Holliday junction branch migration protein RuvA [Verrucomicrobiota bacterium]
MITFLDGEIIENLPGRLVLNIRGIGYEILVPLSTSDNTPPAGENIRILTHLHIREQEQTLYGFQTHDERDLFRLLINRVSGIGPKLGLAVLSAMSVGEFQDAVIRSDIAALSTISGLGKKTAERIVLELKDKIGVTEAWAAASQDNMAGTAARAVNDAVLALISLGYKQADAAKAIKKAAAEHEGEPDADEFIRAALRGLK